MIITSSSPVDLAALRRMDHYPREQRESTIDTGAPLTSQHIRENIAISYFLLFVFSKHPHLQKHWEASQMMLECWIILLRTSDALPTYLSWLPLVCQIPKDDWRSIIGLFQIQWYQSFKSHPILSDRCFWLMKIWTLVMTTVLVMMIMMIVSNYKSYQWTA